METRKGQERKASHGPMTVWSPLTWFHPYQQILKKGCSIWYWTWIRSAMGKTLLWITYSSIRSLFLQRKYPTSTFPEGLKYPKSLSFQIVKVQWSTWIIFGLTCPCTRHLTLLCAELFPSPCQERPETCSGTFPKGQLIISTPLEGSSWPSLFPGGPEGNPEGIYSLYNRDQTNL
jgi:hypothetical protein